MSSRASTSRGKRGVRSITTAVSPGSVPVFITASPQPSANAGTDYRWRRPCAWAQCASTAYHVVSLASGHARAIDAVTLKAAVAALTYGRRRPPTR